MPKYNKGDKVSWNWAGNKTTAKVVESFTDKVERTINGSKITRNADNDNPAYLVEQEDGSQALKSESELDKA